MPEALVLAECDVEWPRVFEWLGARALTAVGDVALAVGHSLRAHPEEARRDARLKRLLARRYRDDWAAYADAKGGLVAELLAAATADRAPPAGGRGASPAR